MRPLPAARDALALVAATYADNRPGLQWRALQDTTNDPVIARRAPRAYRNWQMSEDYYSGGELMWLEADALIRSKTGNRKSLDDFARGFFGVGLLFRQVHDRHVGAFTRVQVRDRAADAGIATGNQRRLTVELARRAVVFGRVMRRRFQFGFETRRFLMLAREWGFGLLAGCGRRRLHRDLLSCGRL